MKSVFHEIKNMEIYQQSKGKKVRSRKASQRANEIPKKGHQWRKANSKSMGVVRAICKKEGAI
jgi:hypothetical protein